ncbi:hypothetical protein FACS1894198_3920 [Clostridia bacterium]|nr:hypothetical protein FACS1894198_3920 [Clostridia bacterium]
MNDVRVHYYVDDLGAWQNLLETEVSWHAGDGGNGAGNTTSIAIEIIMDGNTTPEDIKAEDNGARLAACILKRHGLDISRLTTHKRWSGKNCPEVILPHWDKFVAKVTGT